MQNHESADDILARVKRKKAHLSLEIAYNRVIGGMFSKWADEMSAKAGSLPYPACMPYTKTAVAFTDAYIGWSMHKSTRADREWDALS